MAHTIAIAGFGNIGRAVAGAIAEGHPAAAGITIAGVSDPRFGTVADRDGLAADALLAAAETGTFAGLDGFIDGGDVVAAIDRSEPDTFVELTFTDLDTGEPATSYIRHALASGCNVSTTNKGPISLHLDELTNLADEHGVHLAFEGTVMSGSPAILVAAESISDAGFRGAAGILNGTTNYIITRMEDGVPYEDALSEAQAHGFAEADPTGDVDGHDAAGKLSILTRVLTGSTLPPADVRRTPLSELDADTVRRAVVAGGRWRYVATLERVGTRWEGTVEPRRLDGDHPLASVTGATNALTFHTDMLGDVTIIGPGAGRSETAYSVLNDLRRIAAGVAR
jgi:homoserine dehydrogenase